MNVKFEEVLTANKIQYYSTTPIVTFSSSPNIQYSVWFLATPYPVIATDMLSGHNGLITNIKHKKGTIKVAHPIHTIFLHIFNQLAVTDQGIFNTTS
jgi:hypothetical protein